MMKFYLKISVSVIVILLALLFFVYPAAVITHMLLDSRLRNEGQSSLLPFWFQSAAGRYSSWADTYRESNYAVGLDHYDVAPTEWPMFGSAFWLVAADDLHVQERIDASCGKVRESIDKAAQIIADPVTGSWVKEKWGESYLERENVFYRMLIILGLSSYENITGNQQYHTLMSEQRESLAKELEESEFCVKDDYPGECYSSDVLWSVAAIQRASRLDNTNHNALVHKLMANFDGALKSVEGLPAFQVDARTGQLQQGARGCGNSGILSFAAELDEEVAQRWYQAHVRNFWKDTGWAAGFTELPLGSRDSFADVDSGPVFFEFGSVASAFGIGAARSVGRIDHAAPLTMQAVACSWPIPFGFLLPGAMGYAAVESWSLGVTDFSSL